MPNAFELRDWAGRLGEHGAVLRDCATLVAGIASPAAPARPRAWTVDVARDELVRLAASHPLPVPAPAGPRPSGRPDAEAGIGPGIPARDPPANAVELAARLVRLLADDSPDVPALAEALADAAELARRLPAFDWRTFADAAPERLAAAIATGVLADFAADVRDLACRPYGSPKLVWQSARLAPHGLGPWFSNVRNIVRGGDDVFDLARSVAGDDERGWSGWVALLSRRMPPWLFRHVADDLADHGLSLALDAMLGRALARRTAFLDIATITYLRDAALDIGAGAVAARAQAAICARHPDDMDQLQTLATIHADAGDLAQAHGLLLKVQRLAPARDITMRLEALGTPAWAAFAIEHGFGSPSDRADNRRARRRVPWSYPRRRGDRIAAVEV